MLDDLFISLFGMGVRIALVLGFLLFILSVGRDVWKALSTHE